MSVREERVAKNEAASREINEGIEEAHADEPTRYVRMICECGRPACERVVAITPQEYEQVRADPRWFFVLPSHVMEEFEDVVREHERFVVVAKRPGTPAATAIEEDPRD